MKRYLTVLSIAGSDSCGGAGIQADTKTCCALGVYAMTAITAVTAQNTCGVSAIMGISPEVVKAQIDAVFADIGVDAVKIGMLFNADIARAVAASLRQHKPRHIVLDPVMISTSGSQLIDNDAIEVLLGELMPISSIITPNRHEAERIASMPIACAADIEPAARKILAAGAKAVLMKGGHFSGDEMTDWLYLQGVDRPYVFSGPFC